MHSSASSWPPLLCRCLPSTPIPLWSLPPCLLLSPHTAARWAALPHTRFASQACGLLSTNYLLWSPAKSAVQCSWSACQQYICVTSVNCLPADAVLVAPIANPCSKLFHKAKASRWTASPIKMTEGAGSLADGRCPTAAAAANHMPWPARGSPQLLRLHGSCYGLSRISARAAVLHLTGPLPQL